VFHTVVLTCTGIVYTFGCNEYGQTGHGIIEGDQYRPKRVTGCLESKKVVFVATNGVHTACITKNGDTYTWGNGNHGQLGHGDEASHSTPKLVEGLAGKKAKEVACGAAHTIVRTEDGRVYSFGKGECGQLGHGNFENTLRPTIIEPLDGMFIVQVACGWSHSMALSSDGCLCSWGKRYVNHGSEVKYCVPSIVESLVGYKVVHISSAFGYDKNGRHAVALVEPKTSSYAKKMKAMIDDEICSDMVFLLKDNDRIHANKGLLIGQSQYFRAMFRSGMKESIENEVEVRDCSKGVFLLFLEYLYKGEVDIGMKDATDLYVLSDRYQETDLSSQCLEVIEGGLTNTNAVELLAEADCLGLVALKDICMEYVVSNYGSIEKEALVDSLSRSSMVELLKSLCSQ
jgi:RCC1 and BTB domain-containing protein